MRQHGAIREFSAVQEVKCGGRTQRAGGSLILLICSRRETASHAEETGTDE